MQRLSCLYLRIIIQFWHKAEFNLRIIIFKEFKSAIKVSFCVSSIQEITLLKNRKRTCILYWKSIKMKSNAWDEGGGGGVIFTWWISAGRRNCKVLTSVPPQPEQKHQDKHQYHIYALDISTWHLHHKSFNALEHKLSSLHTPGNRHSLDQSC